MRSLVSAAAVVGMLTASHAQQPTFRAETVLVEVHAVVTDGAGAIVRGLTGDDFVVEEDGEAQAIAEFAFVDLPVTPAPAASASDAPPPGAVTSNQGGSGRAFMFVVDDLRPGFADGVTIRQALQRFVEQHMGDGDAVAVTSVSGRSALDQPFTTDRAALVRAAAAPNGVAPYVPPGAGPRSVVSAMRETALWMDRTMAGRRKVIVFLGGDLPGLGGFMDDATPFETGAGQGIDADSPRPDPPSASGRESAQLIEARRLADVLKAANVSVYPLDPAGLSGTLAAADAGSATRPADTSNLVPFLRANSLRAAAELSGGVALVNSNNIPAFFSRVVQEASSYYVLGYVPPAGALPGVQRDIRVRVLRPGVQVRARRSVVTPPVDAAPATDGERAMARLNAALDSPLALPAVPMLLAVDASPAGRQRNLTIRVTLPVVRAQETGRAAPVDLAYAVIGDRQVVGSHIARVTIGQTAVTHEYRVSLPRGRYQVRVAALDRVTGRVGSVVREVEAP